jgi:hypothetical protein
MAKQKTAPTSNESKNETIHLVPNQQKKTMLMGFFSFAVVLILCMVFGWFDGGPRIPLPTVFNGVITPPTITTTTTTQPVPVDVVTPTTPPIVTSDGMPIGWIIAVSFLVIVIIVLVWKRDSIPTKYEDFLENLRDRIDAAKVAMTAAFGDISDLAVLFQDNVPNILGKQRGGHRIK